MSDDSDGPLFIMAIAVFFGGFAAGAANCTKDGLKAGNCFTNSTCMPGLVCLHGDGHEPGTCVAPADGGAH